MSSALLLRSLCSELLSTSALCCLHCVAGHLLRKKDTRGLGSSLIRFSSCFRGRSNCALRCGNWFSPRTGTVCVTRRRGKEGRAL